MVFPFAKRNDMHSHSPILFSQKRWQTVCRHIHIEREQTNRSQTTEWNHLLNKERKEWIKRRVCALSRTKLHKKQRNLSNEVFSAEFYFLSYFSFANAIVEHSVWCTFEEAQISDENHKFPQSLKTIFAVQTNKSFSSLKPFSNNINFRSRRYDVFAHKISSIFRQKREMFWWKENC